MKDDVEIMLVAPLLDLLTDKWQTQEAIERKLEYPHSAIFMAEHYGLIERRLRWHFFGPMVIRKI